jgi:hypothetical protein
MHEWMLLLTMMTEPNQRRSMPAPPPAPVVRTVTSPEPLRPLSPEERQELQQAIAALTRQPASSELRYDPSTGFHLPAGSAAPRFELSAASTSPGLVRALSR